MVNGAVQIINDSGLKNLMSAKTSSLYMSVRADSLKGQVKGAGGNSAVQVGLILSSSKVWLGRKEQIGQPAINKLQSL